MNRLPHTQQYATNITQSYLNSSNNQNLGYAEKDTTNKNLKDASTYSKNIKATPPTEYINNYLLDPYNKEQNSLTTYFQNISPVNSSINSNTNINHQSNPITTATITTNSFCTKKATSILHTKTHAGEKPYKCSHQDCDKEFKRKSHLQQHIRTHTGEKPYKCTECSKAFIQKNNLQKHVRTHTGEKPFKCYECSKAFSQINVLQNHIRIHTGEKPYKCTNKDCDQAFSQSSALTTHIRTHTGEKPYKCTNKDCYKAFSQSSALTAHIRTHTGEKPYKCTGCSKAFKSQSDLTKHIRTHTREKPYKCKDINCDKAFSLNSYLKNHIRTHTGEKPYKCTDINCDKVFSRKHNLTNHIRTHTGDKPYKCTDINCDKAFSIKSNLIKHIRAHTGEKPYKCTNKDCDKAFSHSSALTTHIRTHTGEKPYKCTNKNCDKAFSQLYILTRHIRTHTVEKIYKCTNKDCDQAFSKSSALTIHIRTHTGEKPFKCPECKKKFNQRSNLKRHISKLHTLKEVLKYKKQPLQRTHNHTNNTSKQNEYFKNNSLSKDKSLIVDLEPLNVFKDVPEIAAKIVATPEVNATSEDELMIIKTEPIDYEYNQGSFFKKRSYEHKIDNTLPILQDPNNSSKSLLQDKLKWFKKLTYQNFLDLQSYIITKSSIKNYNILKPQSNIIKILKKIKQLIDWPTLETYMNYEKTDDNELNFVKDKICIEIIEWLVLNEYNIEDYTNKLNNYVTSIIPIDDKAERGVSVFSNKDINKFDVIGPYAGALVNDKELNNRYGMYGEANICSYLFGTKFKTLAIDGYMTGNILSCVNTAKLSHFAAIGENNLVPIIFANYMIFFVAIKHIPKDTELFINYGDCYKTREEIKQEMTED